MNWFFFFPLCWLSRCFFQMSWLLCWDSLMQSGGYTSTLVGTRARVAPGSRWPSDLHSDGSLLLPSTLMAVELSGDTGAPTQSHIRVQSVQSSTCCHNDYDRSIKMFFIYLYIYILLYSLSSPYRRPTCVPLDWPWWLTKSSSFLKTSLLGGTKQFPSPASFPFSSLLGVHTICAWQHPVGSARWCLSLSYPVCSIITGDSHDHYGSLWLILTDFYWLFIAYFT